MAIGDFTDLIIHEAGGTGAAVIGGTAPNTVNTPGNNWLQVASQPQWDRGNSQLEIAGATGWNVVDSGETDGRITCAIDPKGGTALGDEWTFYIRHSAASTTADGYTLRVSPNRATTAQLTRSDAGSYTQIGTPSSTTLSNTSGDTMTVEFFIEGPSLSAEIIQGATTINLSASDSDHTTGGFVGLKGGAPVIADEFKLFKSAAAGATAQPASILLGL